MTDYTNKKRCTECNQLKRYGKFYKDTYYNDGLEKRCIDCLHSGNHEVYICHYCNINIYTYEQWVQHCQAKARHERKKHGEVKHLVDDNNICNMSCSNKTLEKRFRALCEHLDVEIVYECVDGEERVYAREKEDSQCRSAVGHRETK